MADEPVKVEGEIFAPGASTDPRWKFLRDVAAFELKLALNNIHNFVQIPLTLAVALVDGQPRTLGLKQMLEVFLGHRFDVVRRRTAHRRTKAADRLHLVEGLLVAILDIDEVIQLIRSSDNAVEAKDVGLVHHCRWLAHHAARVGVRSSTRTRSTPCRLSRAPHPRVAWAVPCRTARG